MQSLEQQDILAIGMLESDRAKRFLSMGIAGFSPYSPRQAHLLDASIELFLAI